jgi:hypothetical protein
MNRIKEGGSQPLAEVDNLLQSVGGHGRGARESEALLDGTMRDSPLICVSSARVERANIVIVSPTRAETT